MMDLLTRCRGRESAKGRMNDIREGKYVSDEVVVPCLGFAWVLIFEILAFGLGCHTRIAIEDGLKK